MSEEIELLSVAEHTDISQALWELVKQCPTLDGLIPQFDALDAGRSVGVFILPPPDTRVIKHNVQGGFSAQLGFQIQYRGFPTTSPTRIEGRAFVDKIMEWLVNTRDLPQLSDGREITKITASNTMSFLENVGKDKSTVFYANAVMEYESE